MGKKEGKATSKKRLLSEEEEEDEEEAELNRELAALAAMRAEKAQVQRAPVKKGGAVAASKTKAGGIDDDDDDNYEDIDDDDDDGDRGDGSSSASSKPLTTYNKEGLVTALDNISSSSLPFEETFAVCKYDVSVSNENDDLEVEMAFYNQSLLAVKMGRQKLTAAKIPFKRPTDYFCEMLKTDNHMSKIKDKLISEEKRIEAFDKRRERDNNKKYNKQVEELRKQEKTQSKDEFNSEIDKFKRRKDGSNKHDREEADEDGKIEKLLSSNAKTYKRKEDGDRNNSEKSKKRINMDKKYGLGGQEKKRAKLSDKKSLNDMSTYNPRGGKSVRREKGGSAAKGGKGKDRPGKARREQKKGKR